MPEKLPDRLLVSFIWNRLFEKRMDERGENMFDDAVLKCFLDKQRQLFPEDVAETLEEADDFLEECMAVVVDTVQEVWEYFDEQGVDMEGADEEGILEADEVFEVGDGRYLIVEG